ncbi:Protein of unknown function [Ruminococcus sp. YE71]|uniref:DUF3592 domain-containing protein n=1 Tax=unclassified Ruminococcus TaxID=2608920 RepID=UPI00087F16B8|nr:MULTISPECIES: DUF3592 domain-containing protein [unclassified Ruminococcus]SDA27253.1 Protein of unknown function [Ruminococcus sp. YE78]SFW45325.1 Protein of unknown function [Ruminococcus sp. YE71]
MSKAKRDLIMGLICMIVGVLTATLIANGRDSRKSRCTAEVSGTAVSVMESGTGDDRDYHVTVEYSVDGKTYSESLYTSRRVSEGSGVTVFYDPNEPSYCYLEGVSSSPSMFRIAGGAFAVVGLVSCIKALIVMKKQ